MTLTTTAACIKGKDGSHAVMRTASMRPIQSNKHHTGELDLVLLSWRQFATSYKN
ncbi:hypothetical protein SLEP1_g57409 [Rubroshorea leprosula]|uniref:Uncharacterized protein n=1 Tax=Rubroshorea leprosula TaxID=152421 RepID=A0AAV5MPR2_9ROSI|nr:hypothetical protein SLEP1_g57409 [Rubroshorea leprosula]